MIEAVAINLGAVQPAAKAAGADIFSGVLSVVLSGLAAGAASGEIPADGTVDTSSSGGGAAAAEAGDAAAGGEKAPLNEDGAVMALVPGPSFPGTGAGVPATADAEAGSRQKNTKGADAGAIMALVSGLSYLQTGTAMAVPETPIPGSSSVAQVRAAPVTTGRESAPGPKKADDSEAGSIMALLEGLSYLQTGTAMAVPETPVSGSSSGAQVSADPVTTGRESAPGPKKADDGEAGSLTALLAELSFFQTSMPAAVPEPAAAGAIPAAVQKEGAVQEAAAGPRPQVQAALALPAAVPAFLSVAAATLPESGKNDAAPAAADLKTAPAENKQTNALPPVTDVSTAIPAAAMEKIAALQPAAHAPLGAEAAPVKELKGSGQVQPADAPGTNGAEKLPAAGGAMHIAAAQPDADNSAAQDAGGNKNSQLSRNNNGTTTAAAFPDEGSQAPAREIPAEKSGVKAFTDSGLEAAVSVGELKLNSRAVKAAETAGSGLSAAGVEKIAAAADRLESSGKGKLSLEINEPGLGKVRVEMAISGGDLNISLEVANKEAGKYLSAKVPELMEALAQRGLNTGVELFSGADGGGNGAAGGERNPARRFAPAAEEVPEQELPVQEEGRISLYA